VLKGRSGRAGPQLPGASVGNDPLAEHGSRLPVGLEKISGVKN
jgi:hypothetical protein